MGIENGTHIGDFVVLIISPQIEAGAYRWHTWQLDLLQLLEQNLYSAH